MIDAKIFRLGGTDIRIELDKETRLQEISGFEIETTEFCGDDFKSRSTSRVSLAYNRIIDLARELKRLSDFIAPFAEAQQKARDRKPEEADYPANAEPPERHDEQ